MFYYDVQLPLTIFVTKRDNEFVLSISYRLSTGFFNNTRYIFINATQIDG
jgi:hypothetical protein